jgi:hypothetical protein
MRYVTCCCLALLASARTVRSEELFVLPYHPMAPILDLTGGVFSHWDVLAHPPHASFVIGTDWSAKTLTYEQLGLMIVDPLRLVSSVNFTTGPGAVDTVRLQVTIDPITLIEAPKTVVSILPAMDAYYTIGDVCRGTLPLTLTGTYTLTGPTEEKSGPFSVLLDQPPTLPYVRLGTAAYPNSLGLEAEPGPADVPMVWHGAGDSFVDTTVDGHHVSVGISSFGTWAPGGLIPIPEPSTLTLLLCGLAVAVGFRIRKR